MKERFIAGTTVGFFISLPWLALMSAGQHIFGWIHVPFQLFEFLSWSLPGQVITLAVETLIKFVTFIGIGQTSATGKLLEIALAYLLALVMLSLLSGLFNVTLGNLKTSWVMHGILYGLILGLVSILLASWNEPGEVKLSAEFIWLLAASMFWGLGLAWGADRYLSAITQHQDLNRKRVVAELAIGSAGLTAILVGTSRWLKAGNEPVEITQNPVTTEPIQPPPSAIPTKAGFQAVPGTRPEITPIEDFYRVDINLLPPGDEDFLDSDDPLIQRLRQQGGETDLPADSYFLKIDGLVENPLTLSLVDLQNFPMVDQYATLTCISNLVGGDLIGTTLFQGARLKDVLESAQLNPNVIDIKFTGVDGYTESLPVQAALDPETLLCYKMGNQPLTRTHGSPLRLYTPGRYGIKNPKWIIKIEAVNNDYKGFWQQRGWTESGIIKTTSVIDTTQENSPGEVMAGGIAFSGDRGILSVELRVDDGDWKTAELDRPLSNLTWVLWRADLQLTPGEHVLAVRAIDATGEIQTDVRSGTQPDGATGYHSISITV
jgi:hypothetical protein